MLPQLHQDDSITKEKEHLEETTAVVFEHVCTDVIAGKVLCVTRLHEMYVQCGKEHGTDLSTTKQTLKNKMVERFPGLHFLNHNKRNRSELVCITRCPRHTLRMSHMNKTTSSEIEFEIEQSEAEFFANAQRVQNVHARSPSKNCSADARCSLDCGFGHRTLQISQTMQIKFCPS